MAIHQSGEDYLEAILVLRQEKGMVRSVDVAQHMGYSKPSVSRAVAILRKSGHIEMQKDGLLILTPKGEEIAASIYERHQFLIRFFTEIGVPADIAKEDACRLEHQLSQVTFSCLKTYFEKTSAT